MRQQKKNEPVYCGTCGKLETFYSPKQVDLRDKQYASEEDLHKDLDKLDEEAVPVEPFINDFVTGSDNVEYLIHFCSQECLDACPDAANIADDRKKVAMDWNETTDFKVNL